MTEEQKPEEQKPETATDGEVVVYAVVLFNNSFKSS